MIWRTSGARLGVIVLGSRCGNADAARMQIGSSQASGTNCQGKPSNFILTHKLLSPLSHMKKLLLLPAIVASLIAAAITQAPTAALAGGIGNNYIAPAFTFGGGQNPLHLHQQVIEWQPFAHISIRPPLPGFIQ